MLQLLCSIAEQPGDEQSWKAKYPEVFSGRIGKYKGPPIRLEEDKSVKQKAVLGRRVPFHFRQQVEKRINEYIRDDIVEPVVGGAKGWVSPIVVVPAGTPDDPSKIRICVDMTNPNKAITRERCSLPSTEELLQDLNGAKVFSKIDLNAAYHQLPLHEKSRHLTTFSTHLGLFRFKRLNFGVNAASEIFHDIIRRCIEGIPGVKNTADDILVSGHNKEEHDQRLNQVLQRLRDAGLTANEKKCRFAVGEVVYFGLHFSADGVRPDQKRIDAIESIGVPTSTKEVKSFLGMLTYFARFIPADIATIASPLRALTVKGAPWKWGPEKQKAWEETRSLIINSIETSYFDPNLDTELFVDAGPIGIAALLVQSGGPSQVQRRVIACASKTLSPVQTRYSQIEREALAIAWGCERFDIFLRGKPATIVTDHRPLEKLWAKGCDHLSLRLQRIGLRLLSYNVHIKYEPGENNPADYLSRHPQPIEDGHESPAARRLDKDLHRVLVAAVSKIPLRAISRNELADETARDPVLSHLIKAIQGEEWSPEDPEGRLYRKMINELAYDSESKIVLRGTQIVVPASLQERVLRLAHEGHTGPEKVKNRIRQSFWFPGIDKKVAEFVANCEGCTVTRPKERVPPLQVQEMPGECWTVLAADFCGPTPSNTYLLLAVDEHSRYPFVVEVASTGHKSTIRALTNLFSMFGAPKTVKTDNGPPFNGKEFAEFLKDYGVHHRKSTPLWPQANGMVERLVRTVKRSIRAALASGRSSWKHELPEFLLAYRNTPHASTGISPAQLLLGRPLRDKLAVADEKQSSIDPVAQAAIDRDSERKIYNKHYADKRRCAKPKNVRVGDQVLVRPDKRPTSFAPRYEPKPYTVTVVKGTTVSAQREGKTVTRNISWFTPAPVNSGTTVLQPDPVDLDQPSTSGTPRCEQHVEQAGEPTVPSRPKREKKMPGALKDFVVKI